MKVKALLTEAELQDILRPQLRLFLSVDIIGSTARKQSAREIPGRWFLPQFTFLKEFGESLATAQPGRIPRLKLWKILGDELVYVTELSKATEAAVYIETFAVAITSWNREKRESDRPHVKGAAWVAGFPVSNTLVPLQPSASTGHESDYDYLGPSIDVGFRLSKFGTETRMAVSVELAWLLLKAKGQTPLRFYYEGRKDLKGLLPHSGYPIIMVEAASPQRASSPSLNELEDRLVNRKACSLIQLRSFCEAFVLEHGNPPHLPFIQTDKRLNTVPSSFAQHCKHIETQLRRIFIVETPTSSSPGKGQAAKVKSLIKRIKQRNK